MTGIALTYVLPIRRDTAAQPDDDLTSYLRWLARRMPVIVADGSPEAVFRAHHELWAPVVEHVRVTSSTPNGKVAGVCDGITAATTPGVVVADDDVRYDDASLAALAADLDCHAAVMPQNYFAPAPWHARWDTGRSLLNRALRADYAGTIAIRRSAFVAVRGYCGAVLFENLELMRTLRAAGFDVHNATDVYVARRPPTVRQFLDQRVRQAYDSRAQPLRLTTELSLLPVAALLALAWPIGLIAGVAIIGGLAEFGRRRARGRSVWPATTTLWALGWIAERSVTAWLAVGSGARGGVRYRDRRLRVAAHPTMALAVPGCPEGRCVCKLPRTPGRRPRQRQTSAVECPGGPLLVRGATAVRDSTGVLHEVDRPVVAVCRCEKSSRLPWCDGTHKVARVADLPPGSPVEVVGMRKQAPRWVTGS
jgi:hypothetical protein